MSSQKTEGNSQPAVFASSGSMTILPTILFLITGVLRETAVKTAGNVMPLPVSAALQGIKTIITSPLARVEKIHKQWSSLVRSSLASVLEYSQTGTGARTPAPHLKQILTDGILRVFNRKHFLKKKKKKKGVC